MIPLYTQEEFDKAKSRDELKCLCKFCKSEFFYPKHLVLAILKGASKKTADFCSSVCHHANDRKSFETNCNYCSKVIIKFNYEKVNSKTNRFYCSSSCAAKYNNSHKSSGTRRSKLESWIESQLKIIYPNLDIKYNDKTLKTELDIFIPSLNLAFEFNGIFHYQPIYGKDKLSRIKDNDNNKSKICHENRIDLCVIDTSSQKYVKPSTSKRFLDIVSNIIQNRLLEFKLAL